MPWQQWAVISLWEETRPRRIDCRMEGNNGDFRQYHITEAGFCHFNCNTTTWRGPDITSLPCMSTSLSRNGFKRYLTESLGFSSSGEEQNQRLWLAFMSCCLARSDDKSDGREGVGDLSKHGSDKIDWERPELVFEFVSSLPWDWDITLCPPFIPPFIWLPMLRDILPTSPLRLAFPFSWGGDPIPLCSCLACCKAVAKDARPG